MIKKDCQELVDTLKKITSSVESEMNKIEFHYLMVEGQNNELKQKTSGSSGFDIYSNTEVIVVSGGIASVNTGYKIKIPVGYEAQVRSRSGLASKHGISVLNSPGTIDSDYRDEVIVIIKNHSMSDFLIAKDTRIAQLVFAKCEISGVELVSEESFNEGNESLDRSGGMGSTGISDFTLEDWMDSKGEDEFGRWCAISVNGVTQIMRWFEPGEFIMGSTEDEDGRYDDETQHKVTIDNGYWMADTACTQEFWKAVMGDNPSYFTDSNQNPVEQVSWDNIQVFLEKLNTLKPGLNLSLPTEEQWEKAVRDGSESMDSVRDTDLSNINHKSSSTIEVKKMKPNKKGLYQMIGNVWEWCQDTYKPYPKD